MAPLEEGAGYQIGYSPSKPKSVIRRLAALSRTTLSTSSGKPSAVSASISSVSFSHGV